MVFFVVSYLFSEESLLVPDYVRNKAKKNAKKSVFGVASVYLEL